VRREGKGGGGVKTRLLTLGVVTIATFTSWTSPECLRRWQRHFVNQITPHLRDAISRVQWHPDLDDVLLSVVVTVLWNDHVQ
jgi:hypothetical protein